MIIRKFGLINHLRYLLATENELDHIKYVKFTGGALGPLMTEGDLNRKREPPNLLKTM